MAAIPLHARDGSVRAITLVDDADHAALSAHPWCLLGTGYAHRRTGNRIVLMHRVLMGLAHGDSRTVDHINGDKLDNRRANLRVCTQAENNQNRVSRGGTSRYKGVHWDSERRKWFAQGSKPDGTHVALGRYASEEEAARVAADFRAKYLPFSPEARAAA